MRYLSCVVVLAFALGCGSGDESNNASNNSSVRRTISATVPRAAGPTALVSDVSELTRATEVWAIPVIRGAWERALFKSIKRIPLAEDGSFTFDASGETVDHILALVDAETCTVDKPRKDWEAADVDQRMNCVLGFVSMTASGAPPQPDDESLVAIPTSTQTGDLALGVLQGDDSNPLLARSAVGFVESLDTLQQTEEDLTTTAILDDGSVAAIWAWANGTDDQSEYYAMRVGYNWGAAAPTLMSNLVGKRIPVDALMPTSITLNLETNVDKASAASAQVRLIPPAPVENDRGDVFTPDRPMEGPMALGNAAFDDNVAYWNVPLGARLAIPPGEWVLERDGKFAAKSDLSMGAPYRGVQSPADPWLPTAMVPELIVEGDETHISKVSVRLWQHDGTAWQPVSIEAVAPAMGRPYIGIEGWNCSEMRMATLADDRLLVEGTGTDATFYGELSAEEGALGEFCHVDEITFNYSFGGAQMGFSWRNEPTFDHPVTMWRAPGDTEAWLIDTQLSTLGHAIGETFDCAELFDDATALGVGAQCTRLSAARLRAVPGTDATLKPYDHITFKEGALTWVDGMNVESTDIEVWPRRDTPRAAVDGVTTTQTENTACDVFDVDVFGAEVDGYTFDWSLKWEEIGVGDPGPALSTPLAELLAQTTGPHLGLPLLMVPEGHWIVVADAYNAYGWRQRVETGLLRDPYYVFEILPNWELVVAGGRAIFDLPVTRTCDAMESESWSWDVDGQMVAQSTDETFVVPQMTLDAGEHTVKATVTRGVEVASGERTIQVLPDTMTTQAEVLGSNSVASGTQVELRNLQAYLSADVNQTDVPHLTYWFCFDGQGVPCARQPAAGNVTTLDTTGFAPGSYVVWVHAIASDAMNGGLTTVGFDVLP